MDCRSILANCSLIHLKVIKIGFSRVLIEGSGEPLLRAKEMVCLVKELSIAINHSRSFSTSSACNHFRCPSTHVDGQKFVKLMYDSTNGELLSGSQWVSSSPVHGSHASLSPIRPARSKFLWDWRPSRSIASTDLEPCLCTLQGLDCEFQGAMESAVAVCLNHRS